MERYWLHVGETVIFLRGNFANFEGTILAIDRAANSVSASVEIFGKVIEFTFELSTIDQDLAPFGDQPVIARYPDTCGREAELRACLPQAIQLYGTWDSEGYWTTSVAAGLSETGPILYVRRSNLTTPAGVPPRSFTCPLGRHAWERLTRVVEECAFWSIAHDDGCRHRRRENARHWRLEGAIPGEYHWVVRQSLGRSEIAGCCEYLLKLAKEAVAARR